MDENKQEKVKLLNLKELAQKMNVSKDTIKNWLKDGLEPSVQYKSIIRFEFQKVMIWLKENTKKRKEIK